MNRLSDKDDKITQVESLIVGYAKLFAKKFANERCSVEDFVQQGYLAAMIALDGYTPSKGSWEVYFKKCLALSLITFGESQKLEFKIDHRRQKLYNKVKLLKEEGLSKEQIKKKLDLSEKQYQKIYPLLNSYKENLGDMAYDVDTLFDDIKMDLDKDQLYLFEMCYDQMSIKEIAIKLNVSYNSARQKIIDLFKNIRDSYVISK